ncbi:hypothetical protein DE146DRAFT_665061, partial [Phaeosphaeria sp. MPI-PUGE-AT-0046c]
MRIVVGFAIGLAAIVNVLLVSYEFGMKAFVVIGVAKWFTLLICSIFTSGLHLCDCVEFL